jgi:hypothetical protein
VLELPACFAVHNAEGPAAAVDDHKMTYMIAIVLKPLDETMGLFAFQVANPTEPRSVNIIREADHKIWKLAIAEEILSFLEESFPQLDVRSLVPVEQAHSFVSIDAGRFPKPQYVAHVHAALGSGGMQVVVLGDSGHAFPADLGMGVNSALEDLDRFAQKISEIRTGWTRPVQPMSGRGCPKVPRWSVWSRRFSPHNMGIVHSGCGPGRSALWLASCSTRWRPSHSTSRHFCSCRNIGAASLKSKR